MTFIKGAPASPAHPGHVRQARRMTERVHCLAHGSTVHIPTIEALWAREHPGLAMQ